MKEIIEEVNKLNIDIIVLTETKKKEVKVEIIQNFIHIYTGVEKHQKAKRRVSVLIHKKQRNITNYEAVDENIIRINITLQNQSIDLGIYGVSNDESYADKDEFHEQLNDEITKIGYSREILVLGDLNGKTGKRTNSKVIGPYGEIIQNNNGESLIEICENHKLKITNGLFKQEVHTRGYRI